MQLNILSIISLTSIDLASAFWRIYFKDVSHLFLPNKWFRVWISRVMISLSKRQLFLLEALRVTLICSLNILLWWGSECYEHLEGNWTENFLLTNSSLKGMFSLSSWSFRRRQAFIRLCVYFFCFVGCILSLKVYNQWFRYIYVNKLSS